MCIDIANKLRVCSERHVWGVEEDFFKMITLVKYARDLSFIPTSMTGQKAIVFVSACMYRCYAKQPRRDQRSREKPLSLSILLLIIDDLGFIISGDE